MCTVTFLSGEGSNFILTSNRDEKIVRSRALPPQLHQVEAKRVWYPQDAHARGTWIAASEQGTVLCLLNGAFQAHNPAPPYRKSRGLVLLDYFGFNNAEKFAEEYNFSGIEPFTLIIINSDLDKKRLFELRRDEARTHFMEKDSAKHHIWSSATLYPAEIAAQREVWFKERISQKSHLEQEDILDFHISGGTGDTRNDLVMNRDGITQTVSITSVVRRDHFFSMYYRDMLDGGEYECKIV